MNKHQIYTEISKMIWLSALVMLIVIAITFSLLHGTMIFKTLQILSFTFFILSTVAAGEGISRGYKQDVSILEDIPSDAKRFYSKQTLLCYSGLILFFLSLLVIV